MRKFNKLFSLSILSYLLLICMIIPINADTPEQEKYYTIELVERIQVSQNEVLEKYRYTSEDQLLEILNEFKGITVQSTGPLFPWRHSYSYGSFNKSDIASITAALLGIGFPYWAAAASIATVIFNNSSSNTIYYTSIYSQMRENGILYVRQEWIFYSNSARTNRITNYVITREYSDNGLD